MTKYKLTYFAGTGGAEHIRYIFAYAGQEYEDYRITLEQWPSIKPTTPYGKIPLLEVDGKVFNQSNCIARYLAKQFNLTGKDDFEAFQADCLVDTLVDFKLIVLKIYWEHTFGPIKNDAEMKEATDTHIPFFFSRFEKVAAANSSGYLVGSQVTWADLTFAYVLDDVDQKFPGALQPYPALRALVNKIHSIPSIRKWIETRPPDMSISKSK